MFQFSQNKRSQLSRSHTHIRNRLHQQLFLWIVRKSLLFVGNGFIARTKINIEGGKYALKNYFRCVVM